MPCIRSAEFGGSSARPSLPRDRTGGRSTKQVRANRLNPSIADFCNKIGTDAKAQAARLAIPVIYGIRDFAVSGGLMSYGINVAERYRKLGIFAGKILKGAKPSDFPVQQSVKFEFVVNLKTAKALSLTIPPGILAIADEVIE